jgi:hypothetical protein
MTSAVEQFRHFATIAGRLLPKRQVPVPDFLAFTNDAMPLAVAKVTTV